MHQTSVLSGLLVVVQPLDAGQKLVEVLPEVRQGKQGSNIRGLHILTSSLTVGVFVLGGLCKMRGDKIFEVDACLSSKKEARVKYAEPDSEFHRSPTTDDHHHPLDSRLSCSECMKMATTNEAQLQLPTH